jgi:hypothetical protein
MASRRPTASAAVLVLALALGSTPASAERTGENFPTQGARTIRANPSNYVAHLRTLRAGDRLVLEPGTYRGGLPVHRIVGAPERPVTIEGPPTGRAVFVARRGRNTVSIVDSAHVVIRNLRLDGLDLPVDAVKAEGHAAWAQHITLEGLTIVNHGHSQQTVGISTKCAAWGWVVRGNTIVGAGTGMYFGNSDGTRPFFAGLIESNVVVNPRGYALQIKHQHDRPGIEGAPTAPGFTVIRRNRFVKAAGGSAGEDARPNVLVGHFPLTGPGAQDFYVIYANVFEDNATEALFQGEGNVALYNNVFVNPHGDAIRIQPHNHQPRAIFIFANTVLASGVGIAVTGGEAGFERHVGGNAVFAAEPLRGATGERNFTASYERASDLLYAPFGAAQRVDFAPRGEALAGGDALPEGARRFPDWHVDLAGVTRLGPFFGACTPRPPGSAGRPCR